MMLVKDSPVGGMTWDELRRQARSLENDLDSKLVSLGSIGGKSGAYDRSSSFGAVSMREEFNQNYSKYCKEIEEILDKLTRVNDQMTELVRDVQDASQSGLGPMSSVNTGGILGASQPVGAGPVNQQMHTAKRHREILRDYLQEYRQTRSKVIAARDREDLLGSVYRDLSGRDSNSGVYSSATSSGGQAAPLAGKIGANSSSNANPAGNGHDLHSSSTRLLLDEQERIHRSSRMMDDHLSAAAAVRAALRGQRLALKTATAGLHNLSARFPRIKYLVNAIDCRHRKDSLVLGVVIGICVVFLLIYKLT